MNLIREVASCFFYFFDNLYILRRLKVIPGNMIHFFLLSTFFELITHISKVLINIQEVIQLQVNMKELNFRNSCENLLQMEANNIVKKRQNLIKNIIVGSFDLFVTLMQLQFLIETKFNNGVIALVGMTSSLIALYEN